jgi:hypothetical protein
MSALSAKQRVEIDRLMRHHTLIADESRKRSIQALHTVLAKNVDSSVCFVQISSPHREGAGPASTLGGGI